MDEQGYRNAAQVLMDSEQQLLGCQDHTDQLEDWENDVLSSLRLIGEASDKVSAIIRAYEAKFDGDPEYHIEFMASGYGFTATRLDNCHAETIARLYTREPNGIYGFSSTGPYDFRRTKYPPRHPLTHLEYRSGHDGQYYRMVPDFTDKTYKVLPIDRPDYSFDSNTRGA